MAKSQEENSRFTRRKVFPLLGGTLLLPLLAQSKVTEEQKDGDESYEVLLKPDGTTVRIHKSKLKNAKVVKKNISNSSLMNWLGFKKQR